MKSLNQPFLLGLCLAALALLAAACAPDVYEGTKHKPPPSIADFSAKAGDGQIELSWTNPSDSQFAGVVIRRNTGDYPAKASSGSLVYDGTDEGIIDSGLTNDRTYFYRAFPYNQTHRYGAGVGASAMPSASAADTTPPTV